jgi:hypothetical protein
MKRVYPSLLAVCIGITAITPGAAYAQCGFCSGGVPATTIVQTVPVGPSVSSSTIVHFNKYYDPSGLTALTCFSFADTMSAVSTSYAHNGDPDTTIYNFTTTVNYTVKGPPNVPGGASTINQGGSHSIDYGPDTLAGNGSHPGDSVTNGPDTFFNKNTNASNNNFNIGGYTGPTGTADVNITFGGGGIASGGSTYQYGIKTNYWGVFKLTYYICPSVALATSIKNFTAVQNGNSILLQWVTDNEQNNSNYEIQISTDGKNFTPLGEAESDPATTGSATKYQYQYNPDQADMGKLWFRVKETAPGGKVSYSAIAMVRSGGGDDPISYQAYPNPASNSLIFQFNANQTGRYSLELVNTAGQVVRQKSVTLTGTSQIQFDLNPHPSKGLYYLRTRDLTHGQQYTTKVLIN